MKNRYFILLGLIIFLSFFTYNFLLSKTINNNLSWNNQDNGLDEIKKQIQEKRYQIEKLQKEAEIYRRNIQKKRKEAFSLKNQLSILSSQIAETNLEILALNQQISKVELEIKKTGLEIKNKEDKIKKNKQFLAYLLRKIFIKDDRNLLVLLLTYDSLSEFFNEVKITEELQNELKKYISELKITKNNLQALKLSLENKKQKLNELKNNLEIKKDKLESQKLTKRFLLESTRKDERKFQILVRKLKKEQAKLDAEIVALEKKMRKLLEKKNKEEIIKKLGTEPFIWPVLSRKITAYFHDPDYPYRYIFEHPAIDIAVPLRTIVRASASGYVARAKKDIGCTGRYSYVMIIHGKGLATVYGHLNQIDVNEGQFVIQGQRIGLSGGMPGTCGAGKLTTGPHLHFEVRLNGIPVDPLKYLP